MPGFDTTGAPIEAKIFTEQDGLVDARVYRKGQLLETMIEPVLYITTQNAAPIVDKENYVSCRYVIKNEAGTGPTLFDQPGRIRGRGNSTWTMPKKPWKVKLDTTVTVLGMPASKDFALLANYIDPSKIRNALAFEISGRTGLPWAPRSVAIEVYLNEEYQGLYQLAESVEVDPNRVDVAKIKATDTSGTALTGGYIMEVDTRFEENNEIGWRTRLNVPIIFDTPDGDVAEQYTYMQSYTQACEDALFSESFSGETYANLFDLNSWADWYLLNELLVNNDSGFGASVKMTKPRDTPGNPGKLHLGPAWDFDASCGITFFIDHPPNRWWTRVGATWIARMLEDPTFKARVVTRWNLLKQRLDEPGNTIIDWVLEKQAEIAGAVARDSAVWIQPTAPVVTSWLTNRIDWLDNEFNNGYTDTVPPDTPTGFASTAVSATGIDLTWTAVSPDSGVGVVGYRVRQNGIIVAITAYPYSNSMNVANIHNLTPATQYSFTLEARDAAGNWSVPTEPLVVSTN